MSVKIVQQHGYVVSSARSMSNKTLPSYDSMYVNDGGVAEHTSVGYFASMFISSGGTANHTTLEWYGRMFVYTGGKANNITVTSNACAYVKGGSANGIDVQSNGGLQVQGGYANDINIQGGRLTLYDGEVDTVTGSNQKMYISGGLAKNITVQGWQAEISIYRNAAVNNLTMNNGKMTLYGSADNVTMTGGNLQVSSDGSVDNLTINGGYLTVSSGARATNIRWEPFNGDIVVEDGGYVTYADMGSGVYYQDDNYEEVNSSSVSKETISNSMYIMKDGVADEITLDGGTMYVHSGGTATETTVSRGDMYVSSSGTASKTTVNDWGEMTVYSGGTATETTVNSGGSMYVNGGTATETTVNSWGSMYVNGGTASKTTVNSGGSMYVDGGTATETTVNDGSIDVHDGGIASKTTVNGWGNMHVDGGTATETTVNDWGEMTVYSGGTANETIVNSRGWMGISSGGTATETTVNHGGNMTVYSGGTATKTTVKSGGWIGISSGGTASGIKASSGAYLTLSVAPDTYIQGTYAGKAFEMKDAALNDFSNDNAQIYIENGGSANNITAFYTEINSGGSAHKVTVKKHFYLYFYQGAAATDVTVKKGGWIGGFSFNEDKYFSQITDSVVISPNVEIIGDRMSITSGGTANETTVNSWASMYISSDGTANSTIVKNNGLIVVSSGGSAVRTTVSSGGKIVVSSGGNAVGATVSSGGRIVVSSGGLLKGQLDLLSGASVEVSSGGTVDFSVTGITPESSYLINDLALITGTPDYTITIGSDIVSGTYKLAQGAENFSGTISVGDEYQSYGTITVNGEMLIHNDSTFKLTQKEGSLELEVKYPIPENLKGDSSSLSWDPVINATGYVVEYSVNGFNSVITIETDADTTSIDSFGLSSGTYQWRVKRVDGKTAAGSAVTSNKNNSPQELVSDEDGNLDVFFADVNGQWNSDFSAVHRGYYDSGAENIWQGSGEKVKLTGRNRICDIFSGSSDANILLLTDDANGDALFVDDLFSTLPSSVAQPRSRIAQIDEIRAGAGNDIVDLTSSRFEYDGDGITVYGGNGDDVIWANKGANILSGDAGNDRIVGGSGDDIITGGSGDDLLHGGGGDDIFCFGGNWGIDSVEQLSGGSVTLWFDCNEEDVTVDGSTYTCRENSVTVAGVETVSLKFAGDDTSALPEGVFADSEKSTIFEELNTEKSMLAG